ncbi:unnamed protein product [Brassicogethes aeneus]|uniref:EML-like first beta-propeller domain-containing protein n=1 Tax=Brassicogethes aeneus TaxID=1431903 RepID=A0A9P0BFS7_BRAAE|nr:unnamed protein product [Brassicogethes aeneus]
MSQTEDEAEEISEDNEEQRTESGEETEEWQEENSQATEVQDYRIDDGGEGDYVDYDGLQWVKADWGEEGFEPRKDDVGSVESVYNSADFISKPILSEGGTISLDILQFDFSYGYNCRKYFNMCVLDDDNLVFESGNYLHFFNVETKEIWFRRSALGGGIGHIRKNPKKAYQHLAVAECGNKPIIIIYEWPTMEIFAVLREGTTRSYTHMDYSPDGLLLASQGGEPDYNITVWDWPKKKILLRTKSYVNDVYRVNFSLFVPGQLITCGVAHIKFWKMADTFTGLKLKGEVGRFGKTEYTDIVGLFAMPDGKILSGCSWGNILLWDDGLITLEIMRSQRKRCHDAPIVQMYYNGEELFTVSMDGHIKVWWWEKIDNADPPDDDRVIQVEPNYDFYEPVSIPRSHYIPTGSSSFSPYRIADKLKSHYLFILDLHSQAK